MTLSAGSLGHIRILGTLGAGGMGEVFAGFDETLQRQVALKAIRRRHRLQPGVKARFLREALDKHWFGVSGTAGEPDTHWEADPELINRPGG